MNQARIFSLLVVVVLALYGVAGYYYLPLASFEGSLTRMAMLPESEFGWTKEQTKIDPTLMQSASWEDADVLVIGDSFSAALRWQTVLTKRGLRVRTESWDWVHAICEDFTDWAKRKGFKGKYVVIESLESAFEERLARSVNCKQTIRKSSFNTTATVPATIIDRSAVNLSGRMSVGIRTRINILRYNKLSSSSDFKEWLLPNDVRMSRLVNGCDLFSHRHCNDVLFLRKDLSQDLDSNTFGNIEKINARLTGMTPIWVVVPNKSTVYLYPKKEYWNEAERRFNAPNVLKQFRQAIENKTVDLYPANDFHTSTSGYLLLGKLISNSIH